MRKKKTIACDRCGARIDHIPEKCPECGEILRDRMDPHVREVIEKKMAPRNWKWLFKLAIYLFFIPIVFAACGFARKFNDFDWIFILFTLSFPAITAFYFICLLKAYDKPFTWHLIGHLFVFEAATAFALNVKIAGIKAFPLVFDYVLAGMAFFAVIIVVFAGGLVSLLTVKGVFNRNPKIKIAMAGFSLLLLLAFFSFGKPIWFKVQCSRLESENPKSRYLAFDYLASRGERGRLVIEDFCRRNNHTGWGPETDGLRCRIAPLSYLFEHFTYNDFIIKYGSNFDVLKIIENAAKVRIEVQNINCNNTTIAMDNNSLDASSYGHPRMTIFCLEGKCMMATMVHPRGTPEHEAAFPVGKILIGTTPIWWHCDRPGIYFYELCYSGIKNTVLKSNRICFAVLPKGKKK